MGVSGYPFASYPTAVPVAAAVPVVPNSESNEPLCVFHAGAAAVGSSPSQRAEPHPSTLSHTVGTKNDSTAHAGDSPKRGLSLRPRNPHTKDWIGAISTSSPNQDGCPASLNSSMVLYTGTQAGQVSRPALPSTAATARDIHRYMPTTNTKAITTAMTSAPELLISVTRRLDDAASSPRGAREPGTPFGSHAV